MANGYSEKDALEYLIKLGIELSSESDTTLLLEHILLGAKNICNADGGTIYSVTPQKTLKFETLLNDTLGMHMGGSTGKEIPFPEIPLYVDNEPNANALVAYAVATDQIINIPDVYACTIYNLSAAREMDKKTGYHTQSVLTIPLKNHEDEIISVIQLINSQRNHEIVPFHADIVELIRSLASLAAVALTNRQLIEGMAELFESFTKMIAKAIDEKSPYTGGHCRRVPVLTMMIAEAVHNTEDGPMAEFRMTEKDRYELSTAGWMHDCGKIAIPEYVMDKAAKLSTVFDRIELVDAKIEIALRDLELKYKEDALELLSQGSSDFSAIKAEFDKAHAQLEDDRDFLRKANIGGEFMTEEDQQRVYDIAKRNKISIDYQEQPLLTDEEIYNLKIARGTLTPEERTIINHHMDITIEMLESLPFPKHLRNVPEYAGGHHEKMDGTGYPKGLKRDEMSVPARMMAIADIFEALTAADRPYKPAKPVSECLFIMGKMKQGDHIDPDLFDIFIDQEVYLQYANAHLKEEQMDEIDLNKIPGYIPKDQRS
ncbi:HD family phosphohydrolase [Algicola sagamiensis]|uniref:HD family phosphohydrolase n=1 Tax=Algicola sagamiensis TaxID=163869 RepID=UPI000363B2D3|nr:HD family phosphohydrolase [Algicola sagamiensis]